MAILPAHCQRCDFTFPGLAVPDQSYVQYDNCVTTCPKCGGPAPLADAVFVDGRTSPLNEWSAGVFDRLWGIARAAADRVPSADRLLQEVQVVAPELAERLKPIAKHRGFWPALLALSLVASVKFNLGASLDVKLDLNKLFDQVVAQASASHNPKRDALATLGEKVKVPKSATAAESGPKVEVELKADVELKRDRAEAPKSKRGIRRAHGALKRR